MYTCLLLGPERYSPEECPVGDHALTVSITKSKTQIPLESVCNDDACGQRQSTGCRVLHRLRCNYAH